jgi:hypothetical protein
VEQTAVRHKESNDAPQAFRNRKGTARGTKRTVAEDSRPGVSRAGQRLLPGRSDAAGGAAGLPPAAAAAAAPVDASRLLVTLTLAEFDERVARIVDERIAARSAERRSPTLLDRRGIAAAFDVGVDTIDKLRREGMPTIMVGDSPRFQFASCIAWLNARKRETAE